MDRHDPRNPRFIASDLARGFNADPCRWRACRLVLLDDGNPTLYH